MRSIAYRCAVAGILLGAICPLIAQSQQGAAPPQQLTLAQVRQREAEVLDALDLSRPALAQVAAAWKQKNTAGAVKALAAYLRARQTVQWGPATDSSQAVALSPREKQVANEAVEGRLAGGGNPYTHLFPKGEMDWHYNATYHAPGMAPDDEWQWQMNRMSFWYDLGNAYRATGDERYADAFVREMRSWVAQCPVPDHAANTPDSAWRTIEAGIRMGGSWPDAFFAFRRSPSMTDADLLMFVDAFLDHARYLRTFHTRLNWFTMEMSGLYAVGALFPEFKEATKWRNDAADALAEEARKQILSDGAQAELSTGYQNVALGNILKIAEIARWTGRTAELPAAYSAPLEKGYEWQMNIMTPDRTTPRINDSGRTYLPTLFSQMVVVNFPDRADFKWVASDGAQGRKPDYTSIFLNRSGLAIMRSGWSRTDNYLMFRLGPLGMGHMHQDKLGVIVYPYGRDMIFDSGGGSYEHSKWRQWAVSTYSHNCVIVDGMAQNRATSSPDPWHDPDLVSQGPIDGHWQTNNIFDFASGDYNEGYGPQRLRPASQQRDVLFLKPDMYVIADRMRPNDSKSHSYQARWQLLTTDARLDKTDHVLTTVNPGLANVAIVPLLSKGLDVQAVSAQEFPEILGWNIRVYDNPRRVPATTLLHTQTGTGPKLLLTLIIPLKPGQANPVASVTPGSDGRSANVTYTDGRKFFISAAGERGITVRETLTNGKPGRAAVAGTD
ncbi:MAG TPA: heparinase II/III family protein [Acidobacteriaceae bacterium]|nr:heparinase II/III family protein [Acidobacteriaceae bacterium]